MGLTSGGVETGGLRNLTEISDIPDSAVLRWTFGEGSGTTTSEQLGTYGDQDGSLSTDAMWTSGTWVDGNAISGDSTDDHVLTGQWGSFASNNLAGPLSIIYTIQTTDTGEVEVCDVTNSGGDNTRLHVGLNQFSSSGQPEIQIRDSNSNNVAVNATETVNDGSPHRVLYNVPDRNPANWEIWIDKTEVSTSTVVDEGGTNFPDFDVDVPFLAYNKGGSLERYSPATIDDIIVADDTLTNSEIQDDYDRQPWV